MKLFLPLLSFAAARTEVSAEDIRVWNPDVDQRFTKTLTVDALTDSWILPTDGSGKYEPNKYYRMTVTAPEGYKIRVDLSNFRLENEGFSGECTNDKVDFFDGTDGNNLMTTYCGKGVRPSVKSTGTTLTVVFKSNENGIVDTGFDAAFTAEPLPQEDDHWNSILAQYDSLYIAIYDQLAATQTDNKRTRLANQLTKTMGKFYNFGLKERTVEGCSLYAGTGNSGDFVAPVFDSSDICASLDAFFLAITSYHDGYACLDGLDIDGRTATQKQLRPNRIKAVIRKQRTRLYNKKLTDFSCSAGFSI